MVIEGKKRQREEKSSVEQEQEQVQKLLTHEIPVESFDQKPKISFILDNAAIRKAFIKKKWVVANCFDDEAALKRQNKNPQDYRSEIVNEVLKEILDSRINGYGLVGAIFVRTVDGVLFEVKPHVRIPRTLARFSGLMLELLEKSQIRTNDSNEILMRVVEEPVTRHLPTNSRIIGISKSSQKLVDVNSYVNAASDDAHLVFVEHQGMRKLTSNIRMMLYQLRSTLSSPKLAPILFVVHLNGNGSCSDMVFEIMI